MQDNVPEADDELSKTGATVWGGNQLQVQDHVLQVGLTNYQEPVFSALFWRDSDSF